MIGRADVVRRGSPSSAASPIGNQPWTSARTTATTIGSSTADAGRPAPARRRLRYRPAMPPSSARFGYEGRLGHDRGAETASRDRRRRQTVASAGMDLSERGTATGRHPWEIERFRAYRRILADHGALAARRVLDVGAGDGWFSQSLLADLPNAEQVVCWDINYNELELTTDDPRLVRTADAPTPGLRPRARARRARAHPRPAAVHRARPAPADRRRARRRSSPSPPIPACSATTTAPSVTTGATPPEQLLDRGRAVDRRRRPRPAVPEPGRPARGVGRASNACGAVRRRRQRRDAATATASASGTTGPTTTRLMCGVLAADAGATRRFATRGSASHGAVALGVRTDAMTQRDRRPLLRRGGPLRRRRLRAAGRASSTSWCSSTTARPTPRRRCSTRSPRPRRRHDRA